MSIRDEDNRRERLFRLFATNAIENSHKAVQAVWVVLFSGGTAALINAFDRFLSALTAQTCLPNANYVSGIACPIIYDNHTDMLIASIVMAFICYILTFYRFYVGNIRVYDMRYTEVKKFIENLAKEYESRPVISRDLIGRYFRYVDRNTYGENIFLMIQTIMIISLTLATTEPSRFVYLYYILLVTDLPYLFRNRPTNFFFDIVKDYSVINISEEKLKNFKKTFPTYAIAIWGRNNAAGWILLTLEEVFRRFDILNLQVNDGYVLIEMTTIFFNSFVDLALTWKFYNPRLGNTYHELLSTFGDDKSN